MTRTLHLLDIENLAGGRVTIERCRRIWDEYVTVVGVRPNDQIVSAVAGRNAAAAAFGLPTRLRRVIGRDVKDGADRALMEAIDIGHVASRFEHVVIGSGDHFFVPAARQLRLLGCDVSLALGAAKVAAALYLCCRSSFTLPIHYDRLS